ncbi:hypothetical protein [uncultured Sphingomonas sp.]|uniref:hypothetical protein n=1 Tax=uncultured Sphingomonas sp. TaxID=158754 RepID=UPI0035CACA87
MRLTLRGAGNGGAMALVALIAIAGAALTALAYWPGFMTWDAIRQYGQAVSGDFDDWHPPMMEWVWRQAIPLQAGPAPMLVLQIGLEWGGLAALACRTARGGRPVLAVAIVACGWMPLVLALTGEVLKDCLMAGALLAATGTLAWTEPGGRPAVRAIGIALLVFAATLRFNAFLATVPLCIALLPAAWRNGRRRRAAGMLLATAVMVAALPAANRLLGAKPSGVGLSLVVFDLGGITRFSGRNAFPPIADFDDGDDPAGIVAACYNPAQWDRYAWWGPAPCDIGFDNVGAAFAARHLDPYRWWLGRIAAHPIAYARHRLAHFAISSRLFSRDPGERAVQIDPPPNDWGYKVTPTPLLAAIDAAAVWSATTPPGWPIVWIALALGMMIVAPALPSSRLIMPLARSSFLYGMGYAAFGVASELRYHLWTILAAAIAAVIAGADLLGGAPTPSWRRALAATPPLLALIACLAWRAMSPA